MSPSFRVTTFSTSLTKLSVLLLQSRVCRCNVTTRIWHVHRSDFRNTLIYALTYATCDISLGSLTLPALEAGDLVELSLLYM